MLSEQSKSKSRQNLFAERIEAFIELLRACNVPEARVEQIADHLRRIPDRRMLHYFVEREFSRLSPECVFETAKRYSLLPDILLLDWNRYKLFPAPVRKMLNVKRVCKQGNSVFYLDAAMWAKHARALRGLKIVAAPLFAAFLVDAIRSGRIGLRFNSVEANNLTRAFGVTTLVPQTTKKRMSFFQRCGLVKLVERGCALKPAVYEVTDLQALDEFARISQVIFAKRIAANNKTHEPESNPIPDSEQVDFAAPVC